PISVRPEETFARLRYLLGGLRTIETVFHSDRYAFRAGRNLLGKEFRYLRTVIVTAVVHRGFDRRLLCHQVTNFLDLPALGRRQPPYMVLRLCGDLCFW
ncbi:hypothetical protein ES288_A07G176000v1, partial [Gossypium darwinii]